MKSWIRLGLCMGLLTAALSCTALAATEGYATDVAGTVTYNDNGSYTASYDGATDGQQYVLLVVKGTEENHPISEDTIMYIDQTAASGATVTFENWIPRSTPECVVLLGGFEDGPKVLGTLTAQGVSICGSVTSYNPQNSVMLELYASGTTSSPVAKATIGAESGSGQKTQTFTLTGIPAGGTYDLKITKTGHTEYWLTGIPVEGDMTLNVTPSLSCGDINSDKNVNVNDLSIVTSSSNYNKQISSATNQMADLNGDGNINVNDVSIVTSAKNYNKGKIVVPYSSIS